MRRRGRLTFTRDSNVIKAKIMYLAAMGVKIAFPVTRIEDNGTTIYASQWTKPPK